MALFVQGVTAALILKKSAALQPGQSVFIEAAGGGVGTLAVQLAKLYGAGTVIGGASSEVKRRAAIALGADHAIDHHAEGYGQTIRALTGGRGVDVVMNSSGERYFNEGLDALAPFGTIVVFGSASGPVQPLQIGRLFAHGLKVTGFFIATLLGERALLEQTLAELGGFVRSGKLKVQISAVFPLEQIAAAHQLMEDGTGVGKIVVKIG